MVERSVSDAVLRPVSHVEVLLKHIVCLRCQVSNATLAEVRSDFTVASALDIQRAFFDIFPLANVDLSRNAQRIC